MQKKNPHVVFTQCWEKVIELHFWFTTNKKLHLWQIQIFRGNKSLYLIFLRLVSLLAFGLHCKMVSRFRNRNFFWTPDARCVDNIANKNCATSLWYVSPETEGISLDEALKLIWEKNNNLSLIRPKPTRPSGTGYSSSRYILDWIYSQGIPTDPL